MILILDGSLGAPHRNSSHLAEQLAKHLRLTCEVRYHSLKDSLPDVALLHEARAFVFVTGTYWDSWGSPLQKFLEESTRLEGSSVWLGKAAAVLVTMHSVGGKEVLSRLQGVLSTLGCLIPPMSGMAYSYATHLALEHHRDGDFWCPEDLEVICHNLLVATGLKDKWKSWPVSDAFEEKWMP